MSGRTYWWAKDAAWWRREKITVLGTEFGADGPAVIDWLSCEAKVQAMPGQPAGVVKSGVHAVSRGAFVPLDVVERVLSRSVTLGLLDDWTSEESRFTCRISGWKQDQERGRAAHRKADERDRHAESQPPVTVGHASDGSVTPGTPQDRTVLTEEEGARAIGDGVLHPQLHDVLAVLHGAPGLLVEELAVNAALMSRPDLDALELARRVESWAHEGGLNNRAANRLLMAAADKIDQREAAKTGIRTAVERREDRKGGRKDQRDERADRGLAAAERLLATHGGGTDVA
jgi:hypothetical protein